MSSERLAAAIASLVGQQLDRGVRFVRVPELVSPMPIDEMVAQLRRREEEVRIALLLTDIPDVAANSDMLTQSVSVAIDWRNDAAITEPIVIIGDLERDRAAGLADIPVLRLEEVRRRLFHHVIQDPATQAAPQLVHRMLAACAELRTLTDLSACADYCESLQPVAASTADSARSELWRLGLLPDTKAPMIDGKRLAANGDLVLRLRSMDATSRQRLIKRLAATGSGKGKYVAIRSFVQTGDRKELARLDFEDVQTAFRTAQQEKAGKRVDDSQLDSVSVVAVARASDYDETGFISQLNELADGSGGYQAISVADSKIDWQFDDLTPLHDLLSDPDIETGYEAQSGSFEVLNDDPQAKLGSGNAEWRSLVEIGRKLRLLEETKARDNNPACATIVDEIIGLRTSLLGILPSLYTEGVRLFILSSEYRRAARCLVDAWVRLWTGLEDLRERLPPNNHYALHTLAEQLALCDLRVARQGADYIAVVLPFHPVVVEPRVRAAELFLDSPELPSDFFELVTGSLDPAMPSLTVPLDVGPISLSYAGSYQAAPMYSRTPRQVDSADMVRTLQQLTQRFVNIHPYASLSLSVGLVNPPARTAKQLLRWLGVNSAERVALHVFAPAQEVEEVRSLLDEAAEELVSGEIPAERFSYDVEPMAHIIDLPRLLEDAERRPHVLFMFDVAEVEQTSQGGGGFGSSPLGSLISEWVFDTDPLEDARPVIRPRSGSDQLTRFVSAQAGVLNTQVPAQQRSPLIVPRTEDAIAKLSEDTTWVVLCEGVSSLVPPNHLGEMQLLGRMASGSHVAFVYSSQIEMLLEPISTYLWKSTWISPDAESVAEFLIGSVRLAMPEGLLGFFKDKGALSKESVLGRLGFAAVIRFLVESAGSEAQQLIVSLDTDGARRWLGLRDGPERRADLVVITRRASKWYVEAVEVKARTDGVKWENKPPDVVNEAILQVREMHKLLTQIFRPDEQGNGGDRFTRSRREILKRQVFLEALHQWEDLRRDSPTSYAARVDDLNSLFSEHADVEVLRRIFLVSPNVEADADERYVQTTDAPVPVVSLGVSWLRKALQAQPGLSVEIPTALLDQLVRAADSSADPASGEAEFNADLAVATAVIEAEADGPSREVANEVALLSARLREAFVARNAPFRRIEADAALVGPALLQIPFSVPAGSKLSSLQSQEQDLSRDIGVQAIRISNWPGHPGYAVAEVPRAEREIPDVTALREESVDIGYPSIAIGVGIDYAPVRVSLRELPHLLVAGTTGSGKSVLLRSILWQLTNLYRRNDLDLVVIDAKGMADYLDFVNAPQIKRPSDFHLGVDGALEVLAELVEVRIPERAGIFRQYASDALRRETPVQIRDLSDLLADCSRLEIEPPMAPLVVLIDEFAELVLGGSDRKKFERLVTRFVQIARAPGGHLIAATQRPSTDIVTGVMKSNFSRVALRVQQAVDSRVILDEGGAETLLGRGDLLFKSADRGLIRLQAFSAIGPYQF